MRRESRESRESRDERTDERTERGTFGQARWVGNSRDSYRNNGKACKACSRHESMISDLAL